MGIMNSWVIWVVFVLLMCYNVISVTKDTSTECSNDSNWPTYNHTDLSRYRIVTTEKNVYLQSLDSDHYIVLDPNTMTPLPNVRIKDDELKLAKAKLINDLCKNVTITKEFGKKHVSTYGSDKKSKYCLSESKLPDCPLSGIELGCFDDEVLLTYVMENMDQFLAARLVCNSDFYYTRKPFIQITAIEHVISSSYNKSVRQNILHVIFTDDRRKKGQLVYGICTFDADKLIAALNDSKSKVLMRSHKLWTNSTNEKLKQDLKKNIPSIGVLTEPFNGIITSTASINFEFEQRKEWTFKQFEKILSYAVLSNVVDSKDQLYDKHFIATSHGNIYIGITNYDTNSKFKYLCDIGEDIIEIKIWNRSRLIVLSKRAAISLPLSDCHSYNCQRCFQNLDPACGYDKGSCTGVTPENKATIKQGLHEKNPSQFCPSDIQTAPQELLQKLDDLINSTSEIDQNIAEVLKIIKLWVTTWPRNSSDIMKPISELRRDFSEFQKNFNNAVKLLAQKGNIPVNSSSPWISQIDNEYWKNISTELSNLNKRGFDQNELLKKQNDLIGNLTSVLNQRLATPETTKTETTSSVILTIFSIIATIVMTTWFGFWLHQNGYLKKICWWKNKREAKSKDKKDEHELEDFISDEEIEESEVQLNVNGSPKKSVDSKTQKVPNATQNGGSNTYIDPKDQMKILEADKKHLKAPNGEQIIAASVEFYKEKVRGSVESIEN